MNSTYMQLRKNLEYLKLNQMNLQLDEIIDFITKNSLSFAEGLVKLTSYEIDFKEANMVRSMVKVAGFPPHWPGEKMACTPRCLSRSLSRPGDLAESDSCHQ